MAPAVGKNKRKLIALFLSATMPVRGFGVVFLLCLLFVLLPLSSAQEIECSLPSGVQAPEEVIIGSMEIDSGSVISTVTRLAVGLINQDECLLPGTFFSFSFSFPQIHSFTILSCLQKLA